MRRLSGKRLRLLQLIAAHRENERFPLVDELAREMGLAGRTSLTRMLDALAQEGYLVKHGGGKERNRCIFLLAPQGQQALQGEAPLAADIINEMGTMDEMGTGFSALAASELNGLRLPVVGQITAGPLHEILEYPETLLAPGESLRARPGDFFLTVMGDSMQGDGILSGDLVLIRPNLAVSNGEIAAVQIPRDDGVYESTLKHVFIKQQRGTVILRASNPLYADLELPAEKTQIVGAYRGLVRPF